MRNWTLRKCGLLAKCRTDMQPERWQQIELLYAAAREMPPEERAAYLTQACGDDAELREEVEQLLEDGERSGNVLDRAAWSFSQLLSQKTSGLVPDCASDRTKSKALWAKV